MKYVRAPMTTVRLALARGESLKQAASRVSIDAAALDLALWRGLGRPSEDKAVNERLSAVR